MALNQLLLIFLLMLFSFKFLNPFCSVDGLMAITRCNKASSSGPRCLHHWQPRRLSRRYTSSFRVLRHGVMLCLKRWGMLALLLFLVRQHRLTKTRQKELGLEKTTSGPEEFGSQTRRCSAQRGLVS